MANFAHEPGFCPRCGTILPMLGSDGDVRCYNCKQAFGPEGKD
jgi:tRNA(Ile2) C34 agmatinyltransferase TiaS